MGVGERRAPHTVLPVPLEAGKAEGGKMRGQGCHDQEHGEPFQMRGGWPCFRQMKTKKEPIQDLL